MARCACSYSSRKSTFRHACGRNCIHSYGSSSAGYASVRANASAHAGVLWSVLALTLLLEASGGCLSCCRCVSNTLPCMLLSWRCYLAYFMRSFCCDNYCVHFLCFIFYFVLSLLLSFIINCYLFCVLIITLFHHCFVSSLLLGNAAIPPQFSFHPFLEAALLSCSFTSDTSLPIMLLLSY